VALLPMENNNELGLNMDGLKEAHKGTLPSVSSPPLKLKGPLNSTDLFKCPGKRSNYLL